MSIVSDLQRIKNAKTAIATAITEKGVEVPEGTKIDGMAELIKGIASGGGVIAGAVTRVENELRAGGADGGNGYNVSYIFKGIEKVPCFLFGMGDQEQVFFIIMGEAVSVSMNGFPQNELNNFEVKKLSNGDIEYRIYRSTSSPDGDGLPDRLEGYIAIMENPLGDYDPVLANNTWDKIAQASEEGVANLLWNIGDEIDIQLTGQNEQPITLQIADFNHDDLADGSGKAGITFVFKNLAKYGASMTSKAGIAYSESFMYTYEIPSYYKCLPEELKSVIKEVTKQSHVGALEVEITNDKLFLLSAHEVIDGGDSATTAPDGDFYPIFTDKNSLKKRRNNGEGSLEDWWLRSVHRMSPYNFCLVTTYGEISPPLRTNDSHGVCFGLCV